MTYPRDSWSEAFPAHTCVDHPTVPCPACLKWTGDGFATVNRNIDLELSAFLNDSLQTDVVKYPRDSWSEAFPAHTCVDHPTVPCPACLKWTGDGFATVKSIPQCFPGGNVPSATRSIQYEESCFAVMVRVKWVDGWSWATLMRYPTYEEAASHFRPGQKNVRFGSAEWKHLLNERSPERVIFPKSRGLLSFSHLARLLLILVNYLRNSLGDNSRVSQPAPEQ